MAAKSPTRHPSIAGLSTVRRRLLPRPLPRSLSPSIRGPSPGPSPASCPLHRRAIAGVSPAYGPVSGGQRVHGAGGAGDV